MRIKARALPAQYKLTEQERAEYDRYIAEYLADYPGIVASDLRQLETASLEHVLHLRLVADELENNRHILNTRYSHLQQERAILNDLALSRAARLKEKPVNSSAEEELKAILFGLGEIPTSEQKPKTGSTNHA